MTLERHGPETPRHIALTGASSGIGAALALKYAREGTQLSLLARDSCRLEDVVRQCRELGADVEFRIGDVTDLASVQEWLLSCDARMPVDIVIANAGVGGRSVVTGRAGESVELAAQIIHTNILGVANTILPLLPRFVKRRRGHVVIISSLAAFIALPEAPAYCASKAAVRAYGHGLRRLLASQGVAVTVACPGFVETPMSASLGQRRPYLWSSERAAERIMTDIARGRAESVFPWPLALAARCAQFLPAKVLDAILATRGTQPADIA